MKLGEKISVYRKNNGYSQEELAEKVGVSRQSVSLWETNQTVPSMEKLIQLSEILEVSLDIFADKNNDNFISSESPVAKSETMFDLNMVNETIKLSLKKLRISSIVISILLLYITVIFLVDGISKNNPFIIIVIIVIAAVVYRYFRVKNKLSRDAKADIEIDQNKKMIYEFFGKYVNIFIQSNKTDSKTQIEYKDIKQVLETENYYMLVYLNKYYSVDKSTIEGDREYLQNIFKTKTNKYISPVEKIENKQMDISFKKASLLKKSSLVVFILNFFTMPLALIIFAIFNFKQDSYSLMGSFEDLWLFLIVLPLPILSIILGLLSKKHGLKGTRNIVIGAIMGGLLLIYSLFPLIFGSMISHDYEYVNNIESIIQFELPNAGKITTQDWTGGTSTDGTIPKFDSDILFTEVSEINQFEDTIESSSFWTEGVPVQNVGMLTAMANAQRSNYDYFMIYNIELESYNTLPNESGIYDMIFIGYSLDDNQMKIIEYSIEIIID